MNGFMDREETRPIRDVYKAAVLLRAHLGSCALDVATRKRAAARQYSDEACVEAWEPVIAALGELDKLATADIELRTYGEPTGRDAWLPRPSSYYEREPLRVIAHVNDDFDCAAFGTRDSGRVRLGASFISLDPGAQKIRQANRA